jgi:hypothetical protein
VRIVLTDEPVLFETEGGLVVLRGSEVLFSQKKGSVSRSENLVIIAEKAKEAGLSYIGTMDASAAEELVKLGVAASQLSEAERDELNSQKLAIMVKSGFAPDEAAAFAMIREMAVTAAEASITETSSREDLQLVHGIQGLDELDKNGTAFTSRSCRRCSGTTSCSAKWSSRSERGRTSTKRGCRAKGLATRKSRRSSSQPPSRRAGR